MGQKLTEKQKKLLDYLSFDKWQRPPHRTSASTILSLKERGLIKMRLPEHWRKIVDSGDMRFLTFGYPRCISHELRRIKQSEG